MKKRKYKLKKPDMKKAGEFIKKTKPDMKKAGEFIKKTKPDMKKAGEFIKKKIAERRIKLKRKTIFGLVIVLLVIGILSITIGPEIFAGKDPALSSFFILNFAGYLFFILMPVEILVPYYLAEGHSGLLIIIGAVITAMVAQVFDYMIGYLASSNIIYDLIGRKKYNKAKKTLQKYGDWIILLFNLFPLSSPIAMMAAGMIRLKIRRVFLFSFIGLVVKYVTIVYVVGLFA
ncbi:VTT domain-containing protein [Thermoproteota archaeon]